MALITSGASIISSCTSSLLPPHLLRTHRKDDSRVSRLGNPKRVNVHRQFGCINVHDVVLCSRFPQFRHCRDRRRISCQASTTKFGATPMPRTHNWEEIIKEHNLLSEASLDNVVIDGDGPDPHHLPNVNAHVNLLIRHLPLLTWPPRHHVHVSVVTSPPSSTMLNVDDKERKKPDLSLGSKVIGPVSVSISREKPIMRIIFGVELPEGFNTPIALLVSNRHPADEFFLESAYVSTKDGNAQPELHQHNFWCNSWIPQTLESEPRIFFPNKLFLPTQTPLGLQEFRGRDLHQLRGDGTGHRIAQDRIYDYDVYNDLGNPEVDPPTPRLVLGGSHNFPYPRRCRTGRQISTKDNVSELPDGLLAGVGSIPFYVPRDETFGLLKQLDFGNALNTSTIEVATALKENLKSTHGENDTFNSLDEIFKLYSEHDLASFPKPGVVQVNKDAWYTDEEFARERLAGQNPMVIERVEKFPIMSALDPKIYGPPKSAITAKHLEQHLQGLSVNEAIAQRRLFMLDYHDLLMPALPLIKKSKASSDVRVYATRTLFFHGMDRVLRPVAIELSLPPHIIGDESVNMVFTPPRTNVDPQHGDVESQEGWFWQLAKAQVLINDTGYHQLISHWLRTHACVEPFIIATHRQLSSLHPLHRFLAPHFKDTLAINGLARQNLINSGGIIETCFFTRDVSMAFTSMVYRNWRFDEQGLPNDLIKRGMVENKKGQLTLVIEDYPYAKDGLELWDAIQSWAHDYIVIYYEDDKSVEEDRELQAWWKEIKEVGHGDHKDAKWWGDMGSISKLETTLTTIIWLASAHHAAVNFGQYAYQGFMPNSPTVGRKWIPNQDDEEFQTYPEKFFLNSLSNHIEAIPVMGTVLLLSKHLGDEVYLGDTSIDPHEQWARDPRILLAFNNFKLKLAKVEANIQARNDDPKFYKHRQGPAKFPYKLLFPSSPLGMTNQGVPNSISI